MKRQVQRWWKRRQHIRRLKSWEAYLYNYGPMSKWIQVRDENTRLGVWNGTYRGEE